MRLFVAAGLVCLLSFSALAQSADQEVVSVVDAPDPVVPGNNVTYTVTMRNNGPDPATNGGVNILLSGATTTVSAMPPAGFICTPLGQIMSCTIPSFAAGTTAIFTIVVNVPSSLLAFPDGSFTSIFTTSGVTPDPNFGNNSSGNVTTNYDSPQIDMALSVTDSPDPVAPNNDITYTIPIINNGPDTATSVQFNSFNSGTLKFQSITIPPGFSCPSPPAVGGTPTFTCTSPSMASGATATFTVVVRADSTVLGVNDGTVSTFFGVNATGNETNNGNNGETENTAYQTPKANLGVAVTDSPDPVTPNNDITYTVTVTNAGPDAATSANLGIFNNGSLQFQSGVSAAGWNCTFPSVNATPTFNCTNPSFANGGNSVFTFVVRASSVILGNNDGTVSTAFSVGSGVADPVNANNSETEDTAYDVPNADIGVTASDAPDPVTPGNNITYTGTITNGGPDTAANATFTVLLNGNSRFQSRTGPAGFSCTEPAAGATGTINCTGGSIANAGSVPFTLVVQVDPALLSGPDGSIAQNFVVGTSASNTNHTNDTATVTTSYLTPDADLSTTNSDSPDPVNSGGTITYTQSITNNGPDVAVNAVFSQVLPASVGFQSLNAPAGWTCGTPAAGASGAINCTKPSMANGETGAFTLTVNVLAASGTIGNTVVSDSDTYDPDPLDNNATVSTTVTSTPVADLALTNTTPSTSGPAGSFLTYTLGVTNNGPAAAPNVVLTDTLPSTLLFQSITEPPGFDCSTPPVGSSGTITCTAPTLANGGTATFTLVVQVAPGASGSIVNAASVTSGATDPNSGNGNTGTSAPGVLGGPASADVSIMKTTATTTATLGSQVTYTITVRNNGPSPATGVVVSDTLPPQLAFFSATPTQGTCNATSPVVCNIGSLANGATATITLVATVVASGSILNSASVAAAESDPAGSNNGSTAPPINGLGAGGAPTLSEWALMLMTGLLGMIAIAKLR